MSGIIELDQLLKYMSPKMMQGEYVFCFVTENFLDYRNLNPLATFQEEEGLTLIITVEAAKKAQLDYEGPFKQITLTVHSSLEAVGLTAAVASKLTTFGIGANVVAAYFHDHIFVPKKQAALALEVLNSFAD